MVRPSRPLFSGAFGRIRRSLTDQEPIWPEANGVLVRIDPGRTQCIYRSTDSRRCRQTDVVENGSSVTATERLELERALFAGTLAVRSKRWDTSQTSCA
jgi:hypothetical protein